MQATFVARTPRAPVARVFGPAARILNPVLIRLAGTRWIPLWAIVRHRGRRSSRWYATPVAIGHRDDALFVPLPFGSTADWLRNVLAAGACVVRWKGVEHRMIDPEIVEFAYGLTAFNPIEARLLQALGIKGILRLRFADASWPVHETT
jgi:deazaflavin-dependent oxidoreductase (nitroreductase family)